MNIQIIKNKGKNYIRKKNNKKNLKSIMLILLCIIFFIGVIIGVFYLKNKIDNNYFEQNPNILESIDLTFKNNINNKELFLESLVRNIIMIIFIWITGLSILGIPVLILFVLYDGFSLGISISYILVALGFYNGYDFMFRTMLITTFINTASMIFLCNSAIKVTINIIRQKTSIKSEFIRHSIVCIGILILLFFSSIIEVYLVKLL